jgi:hypothetical protein
MSREAADRWVAAGVVAASIALAGCSSGPIGLGQDPDIIWWTNNESRDFRDWTAGGPTVGRIWISDPSNQFTVSTDQARSGHYSLRATITTTQFTGGPPIIDGVLAIRAAGLPTEAYYSAWYYLPLAAFPGPADFWLCFKFRSRTSPLDPTTTVELWDIDLGALSPGSFGGDLALDLFRHTIPPNVARQPRIANPPAIPTGRWFQIEAFYRAAPDSTGEITVWQDGVMVFDFEGQATAPSNYVEWSVGSVSDGLTPPTATIYIDDAAVSRRRLGPSFPPFSSGG